MSELLTLPVLVLDAQAAAGDPARGALIEIGWAAWRAGEERELAAAQVTTRVVAPPPGTRMPPAVARITGLGTAEWVRGTAPALVWEELRQAAEGVGGPTRPTRPTPTVIHFARFEEPHLRALHQCHGTGRFPLDLVCTHAIARRLLPELPRRTLRALAGYLGAGVSPLRRSADHVAATAFVWRHLVALLVEREGVLDFAALREWLTRPPRSAPRCFPLPRERRLELPSRPGVYRLLRAGGAVLYVGKASSLRQRVSSHFHAGAGERALEMLTQTRDLACTETALEAALLEADEIKRLAPPFNLALTITGRSVWFANRELADLQQGPGSDHAVGPLFSPAPFEALGALRKALSLDGPASRFLRSRAVGVEAGYAPEAGCFDAGLIQFRAEHGCPVTARDWLRLGARLWARRRAALGSELESEGTPAEKAPPEVPRRPAWDAERVARALEETVLRAAHAVRRGRWLVWLSECSLAWAEPGAERLRLLVFQSGAVVARADLDHGAPVPVPPGHLRTQAERRAAFDVASVDRLRVLTTELRGLVLGAERIELRLGPQARLSRCRLRAALRWV